jgi:hypothetical protein
MTQSLPLVEHRLWGDRRPAYRHRCYRDCLGLCRSETKFIVPPEIGARGGLSRPRG